MSTPFLAQIEIFSFNFAPKGWALCNGQLLPINQNQALFSLLGTTFGGDGRVNFALPDLRSRVPIHMGSGFNAGRARRRRSPYDHHLRDAGPQSRDHDRRDPSGHHQSAVDDDGARAVVGVNDNGGNFPLAIYGTAAPGGTLAAQTITNTGGSQAHTNLMPYLCLNMSIALQGIFPSQT